MIGKIRREAPTRLLPKSPGSAYLCFFKGASATMEKEKKPKHFIRQPEFPGGPKALTQFIYTHLRYPAAARDQAIEGVAMVQFAIARDGTVIGPRLLQGSGSVLLDHEAVALLRRVSPLPRLPDSVPGAQASVVVPVGFQLR
jgi:TonB family protein